MAPQDKSKKGGLMPDKEKQALPTSCADRARGALAWEGLLHNL